MFNPIITTEFRILGRDALQGEAALEEKIQTLYPSAVQGKFKRSIYYDGSISEEEFKKKADFVEFIQQWKVLVEKVKRWMSEKGISFTKAFGALVLNQDQILDRVVQALEDPQGAHMKSAPDLGNSAKKALEKVVLILQNTERPIEAKAAEPILIESLEGLPLCAPRCANSILSLFENLYQIYTPDLKLSLLQHKTAFVKTILLKPLMPTTESPFDSITHKIAALLHPNNKEAERSELMALRGGDQVHVIALIQEGLSDLPISRRFITHFDPNDYFKNALLFRIQQADEEYIKKMSIEIFEIVASRYHPLYVLQKLTNDLVQEIESFFPTEQSINYEQAKKMLGPWKEQIVFEEMYALHEKDGKTYLNKERLYEELFSCIEKELFAQGFFDRALVESAQEHFYVSGHLRLSWINKPIVQEGRRIAIQPDSSIAITAAETDEDSWIMLQKFRKKKIFLTPEHWMSELSVPEQREYALRILFKDPTSTRNVLLEMHGLEVEKKYFAYLLDILQASQLDRDGIALLWHFLFLKNDLVLQEKIKYFIGTKIGPSLVVDLLKVSPRSLIEEFPDQLIVKRSAYIETLIQHLYSLGWRDFSQIQLTNQRFREIVLKNSVFDRAVLSGSFFTTCDLTGASFRAAKINHAQFADATILQDVDFTSADLQGAIFDNVALVKSKNLERANLEGAEFYLVEFSPGQLQHTAIRNALRAQISTALQKGNLQFYDSREIIFWMEIYKELVKDDRDFIVKALTEKQSNRIHFLSHALNQLPRLEENRVLELIKLILVPENEKYLQHASAIFETIDFQKETILEQVFNNRSFSLFIRLLSIVREIAKADPALVVRIFSTDRRSPLLHAAISLGHEESVRSALDVIAVLPPEEQAALLSLAHAHRSALCRAVHTHREKAVSQLCSMILKVLKEKPSSFQELVLFGDPVFKVSPLEQAVFLRNVPMVSDILDLFDYHYLINPELTLSGIFLFQHTSPFEEYFLERVHIRADHEAIVDRFFKSLKKMEDVSIFHRGVPLLSLTIKYLKEKHILLLLNIFKMHSDAQKALELLHVVDEQGIRVFDRLIQHTSPNVKQLAQQIEAHFKDAIAKMALPLCRSQSASRKRSPGLGCNRDALLQEIEAIEDYPLDSTWTLQERELGFLLHFAEREGALTALSMQEWSEKMVRSHRDQVIDLYHEIHRAKQRASSISQDLESVLAEALPRSLWIDHQGHSFFLSIDSSQRETSYILHDLWLFKGPQRFSNVKETLEALSKLYQIDFSTKQYQAYSLQEIDPNGIWKEKTKTLLENIRSFKGGVHNYFSFQGKSIPYDHPFIENLQALSKDLQFRPQDFIKHCDRLSQENLLEIQTILKKQKTNSLSFDLELSLKSKKKQRKITSYWQGIVDTVIAIPESELLPSSLARSLSKYQVDYLLNTPHFALSEEQRKALSERSHGNLLQFMEKTSSHMRTALPWLQTLVDVSHGQLSGAAMLIGSEAYTQFVAPRLENWLVKSPYLNNLLGKSLSRSLGKAIYAGSGMVLGFIPIGDGIAKMSRNSPGSLEFREGSLEFGTGIGFFLSSLISSPIGLFTDLILVAISTFEGGELAIKRLEHDSYIILEKTVLNRFLMGLGIMPLEFLQALEQADLEIRSGQLASSVFSELESHYRNASRENGSLRIPVAVYTWPTYEGKHLRAISSQEELKQLKEKYPELLTQHLRRSIPGTFPRPSIEQIQITPSKFFLTIKEGKIPFSRKTFRREFSASIDRSQFKYLYGPHQIDQLVYDSSLEEDPRRFQKIFEGSNQTAAFTFAEISTRGQLPALDQIFPHIDQTEEARFQGRANDTLTILSGFSPFPWPFYSFPLAKRVRGEVFTGKALFYAQGYGQFTFKCLEKTASSFEFRFTEIGHFALDLQNITIQNTPDMYSIKEEQMHFDRELFLSWAGYSAETFSFFGPSGIPGAITLPKDVPSQITLPALSVGSMHRIEAFDANQAQPSIIRLNGPGANIYIQFKEGNAINTTYQGINGPRALVTWQERENAVLPILQFEGDMQNMHPILTAAPFSFQNKTQVKYGMLQSDPFLKVEIDLLGIREAEVIANYKQYPIQLTLLGTSKQSILSVTIPNKEFVKKAKDLHKELLALAHICYIWNPTYTRVSIGASHSSLLPGALVRLYGKGQQYEEIRLQRVNQEADLWILPNLSSKIIIHTQAPSWISLQLPAINRIDREGDTLHLRANTSRQNQVRREEPVEENSAMTISIPHYFPKGPPLYINEILYEVKVNQSNTSCLGARLSIFDPPTHQINQETLVNACCEIAIEGNTLESEKNFFLGNNLQVGPITLNLAHLSDTLQVMIGEEQWSLLQLRALKMKRMLTQKQKYDNLFPTLLDNSSKSTDQNRTRRMVSPMSSSSAKMQTPISWMFDICKKYISFSPKQTSHSQKLQNPTFSFFSPWSVVDALEIANYAVRMFFHHYKEPVLTVEEYLLYYHGNEYFQEAPSLGIPFELASLLQKQGHFSTVEEIHWEEIVQLLRNFQSTNDLEGESREKIENFPLLLGDLHKKWVAIVEAHLQSKENYQKMVQYHLEFLYMKRKWHEIDAQYRKKRKSAICIREWIQLGDCIEDAVAALEKGQLLFEKKKPLPIEFFRELPEKEDIRAYYKLQIKLSKEMALQ